jgi:hypothetical protein
VIEGCQMDLEQTRYLDLPGLQRYCHLVAGVVGEVSARIFGQTDPRTTAYAHKLGLAFQLTNIIRDVGEDAMRGRIYLPVSELQQFDVKAARNPQAQLFRALHRPDALSGRARAPPVRRGLALLPAADRRAQKPGLMMASIYRTLLREIEHENFQVLHQRIASRRCASSGWRGRCRRWGMCDCGCAAMPSPSLSSGAAGPAWLAGALLCAPALSIAGHESGRHGAGWARPHCARRRGCSGAPVGGLRGLCRARCQTARL